MALVIFLTFPGSSLAGDDSRVAGEAVYHPMISSVQGEVKVKGVKYDIWEPAEVGTLLLSGDIVRTGEGASAQIQFLSGSVQLYGNTVVIIPSTGAQDRKKDIKEIVVEEGKSLFDINPVGVQREFEFRTKNVQGGVKGTLFTVSHQKKGTAVNVYEGVVVVSDLERSEKTKVQLNAGESLWIKDKADFSKRRVFDPSPALEDYQYNVTPGLDGRGLPADYNANPDNSGVRNRGHGREIAPGQQKQ